jgi:CubicO group peptidase (beta-lactamase class C family)
MMITLSQARMSRLSRQLHRSALAALTILLTRSAHAQSPEITSDELLSRLTKLADSLAKRDELSGVVLVTKDGQPVFERAYGFADREARRANTVGTTFNISSIGKRFTQVATGQLEAAGKLHLDSTIASVWPDYPNRDVAQAVTIRQLLEHRSGIAGDIFQRPMTLRRNRDYIALFASDSLHFKPGTREEYSNAGYVVLGEIIARASGEDYYAYVKRHVFDPAAMTASGFFARDSLPPSAAIGYTRKGSAAWARAEDVQPRRGSAAGGAYTSARDLLKFILANRSGQLGVPMDSRRSVIAGGSPGSNGVVAEGLPGGYDLIVLENLDPPSADAIVAPVMSWLGAGGPGPERRIAAGAASRPVKSEGAAKLPASPVGRIAADYLRAYNSGEPDSVRAFFDTEVTADSTRPTAVRVERYKSIFADNGRLELVSVDDETPISLTITVNTARNQPMSMTFGVEPGGGHRLTSLQLNISR